MAFFNKRRKNSLLKVKDLKVATAIITSSYNDGSGRGPRCVEWYFLVQEVNGKYYEIFAGEQIEMESNTHHNGACCQKFDTPYIEKLEPLEDYLNNPKQKNIKLQLLFDFILNMNVVKILEYIDNKRK